MWIKDAYYGTSSMFTAISVDLANVQPGVTLTCNIQGNQIKNFNWTNSANSDWNGIVVAGANGINIGTTEMNIIGDTTGTASITLTNATSGGTFNGIKIVNQGITVCQNNRIGLITTGNQGAGFATNFIGIHKTALGGTTTIKNNIIGSTSLTNSINATSTSTGVAQTVYGIYGGGTGEQTIAGNTIAGLNNATTNTAGSVAGIYYKGYDLLPGVVSGNYIYGLTATGSGSTAAMYGIQIVSGKTTYSNNIVSLGGATPTKIYGIFETGASANDNSLYFNTVYIGGIPESGYFSSYALYSEVTSNTRDFRNNIFNNARSNFDNSVSGNHYAAYFNAGSNPLTIDYNDYFVSGTGGAFGYFPYSDITSLAAWQTAIGQDVHSLNAAPGISADSYMPGVELPGISVDGITTDYAGTIRAATPTMGAYEAPEPAPAITSFTPTSAGAGTTVTITGTNFTGATAVSFGGTAAASFIINSETEISAVVGIGTTGSVSVTNPGGTATSSGFTSIPTVGVTGATYATLKAAFDAINAGTLTGAITLQIIDNTTETATAFLFARWLNGLWGSVTPIA
jgi:hypothetical protein